MRDTTVALRQYLHCLYSSSVLWVFRGMDLDLVGLKVWGSCARKFVRSVPDLGYRYMITPTANCK